MITTTIPTALYWIGVFWLILDVTLRVMLLIAEYLRRKLSRLQVMEMRQMHCAAQNAVAGALFDFAGFLTSHPREITLSQQHDAALMMAALSEFAETRKINIDQPDLDYQAFIDHLAEEV